jgi:hypothetical protein
MQENYSLHRRVRVLAVFGNEAVDRAIAACRRRRGYGVTRMESLAVAQFTQSLLAVASGGQPLRR